MTDTQLAILIKALRWHATATAYPTAIDRRHYEEAIQALDVLASRYGED